MLFVWPKKGGESVNGTVTRLVLDLAKSFKKLNQVITLRQSEANSSTLEVEVTDHDREINLDKCAAEFHFIKPSPSSEVCVVPASIKNNKVICTLSGNVTDIPGDAEGYFQIVNNNKSTVVTTSTIYLQILPGLIPVKKKDPNEPQPVDLQTIDNKDKKERKAEWVI